MTDCIVPGYLGQRMTALQKRGPFAPGQFPVDNWDSNIYNGFIVQDADGTFRLFYNCNQADGLEYGIAVATSPDLQSWSKPLVDATTYQGSTANNLVGGMPWGDLTATGMFIDDGKYVLSVRNSDNGSNLVYTSTDGENFTFQSVLYNTASHGEHVEAKGMIYADGLYRSYYNEGHFTPDAANGKRSIGYYTATSLAGPWTDQGLRPEFTSTDRELQYYDFAPFWYGDALWAVVPEYNRATEQLGPLRLYRSVDNGVTWERSTDVIQRGGAGEFDEAMVTVGNPILIDGVWHMLYTGSAELHSTWPRVHQLSVATSRDPLPTFRSSAPMLAGPV